LDRHPGFRIDQGIVLQRDTFLRFADPIVCILISLTAAQEAE
jgi:hypothetical protein